MIDKRCRVRIYVGDEVVYIHVAQGSGPCSCIRVAITTRQVSAVTIVVPKSDLTLRYSF